MPIPTLTFYKMPSATAATNNAVGLHAALFASGSSATDYRGTVLPGTHQWAWTADVSGVATAAKAPVGTATFRPGLVWFTPPALSSWTFLGPDGNLTANDNRCSITKDAGNYTTYDSATPYTTACPGSWAWAPPAVTTTVNVRVQVYISQEVVVVDAWSSDTAHSIAFLGAVVAPFTESSGESCESDSRLYGMYTTGAAGGLPNNFMDISGGFPSHSTANRNGHGMVFVPGSSTLVWTNGKDSRLMSSANLQQTDLAGNFVRRPVTVARSTGDGIQAGIAVGTLREVYNLGAAIGGQTRRNGATDVFHTIGYNSLSAGACFALNAAP